MVMVTKEDLKQPEAVKRSTFLRDINAAKNSTAYDREFTKVSLGGKIWNSFI